MRVLAPVALFALLCCPALASAQGDEDGPPPMGGALDPTSYASLTADDDAQLTLSGFRGYLERIRESDAGIYGYLDPRLDDLESRDFAADVIFWTATGLAIGALGASIPVYTEVGADPGIGLIIGGLSTFVLGLIIQAVVRPGHQDLVQLIDLHDERVGRR